MENLIQDILTCTICASQLSHAPNPVLTGSSKSKIIIVGQTPGSVVNKSGIPWDDKSGINLRNWLTIDSETFYDPKLIALVPMGFCYPGKGKFGDLPPRPECAPQWHQALFRQMKQVQLVLLIGKYAQDYYLQDRAKPTLTETVRSFEEYLPKYFVLPHPSPRNNIWQARNKWFKETVVPSLQAKVRDIIE